MDTIRSNKVDRSSTKVVDMHQRRTTNGCRSVEKTDYVIQEELNELKAAIAALESRIAALEGV